MSVENKLEPASVTTAGHPSKPWKLYAAGVVAVVAMAVLVVGAFALHLFIQRNFHVVSSGKIYRAGQMNVAALRDVVQERGIKTILNLRGPAEGIKGQWYNAETNLSHELGVQHFDFSLLAGQELKDEEMEQILATIAQAPKPVLIHCKSGSDRTGLVGALYLYSLEENHPGRRRGSWVFFAGMCHIYFGGTRLRWTGHSGDT